MASGDDHDVGLVERERESEVVNGSEADQKGDADGVALGVEYKRLKE